MTQWITVLNVLLLYFLWIWSEKPNVVRLYGCNNHGEKNRNKTNKNLTQSSSVLSHLLTRGMPKVERRVGVFFSDTVTNCHSH